MKPCKAEGSGVEVSNRESELSAHPLSITSSDQSILVKYNFLCHRPPLCGVISPNRRLNFDWGWSEHSKQRRKQAEDISAFHHIASEQNMPKKENCHNCLIIFSNLKKLNAEQLSLRESCFLSCWWLFYLVGNLSLFQVFFKEEVRYFIVCVPVLGEMSHYPHS